MFTGKTYDPYNNTPSSTHRRLFTEVVDSAWVTVFRHLTLARDTETVQPPVHGRLGLERPAEARVIAPEGRLDQQPDLPPVAPDDAQRQQRLRLLDPRPQPPEARLRPAQLLGQRLALDQRQEPGDDRVGRAEHRDRRRGLVGPQAQARERRAQHDLRPVAGPHHARHGVVQEPLPPLLDEDVAVDADGGGPAHPLLEGAVVPGGRGGGEVAVDPHRAAEHEEVLVVVAARGGSDGF